MFSSPDRVDSDDDSIESDEEERFDTPAPQTVPASDADEDADSDDDDEDAKMVIDVDSDGDVGSPAVPPSRDRSMSLASAVPSGVESAKGGTPAKLALETDSTYISTPPPPSADPVLDRRALFRPSPPFLSASSYLIEPYVAALHGTAIHSLAASRCASVLLTGGDDGHVRAYDMYGSMNGKVPLTQAQKHPFNVETITRGGVCTAAWPNEMEDGTQERRVVNSPVYSLAMQQDALWGLSGTASGSINLFTLRHDEGKLQHVLKQGGHTEPVSAMTLSADETGLYSASWDRTAIEWDLNTGKAVRNFSGHAGQLSCVALRPISTSVPNPNAVPSPSAGAPPTEKSKSEDSYDPLFDDEDEDAPGEPDGSAAALALPGATAAASSKPATSSIAGFSNDILMTASVDGQIMLWDRRVKSSASGGVARVDVPKGTPPWCTSAVWSITGASLYAGRRNSSVEIFDIRSLTSPSRTLKMPFSSGPVSCVAALPDGRHLVSASHDNLRLWSLARDAPGLPSASMKPGKGGLPFKIMPGHHGGTISQMREFMVQSGERGGGKGRRRGLIRRRAE